MVSAHVLPPWFFLGRPRGLLGGTTPRRLASSVQTFQSRRRHFAHCTGGFMGVSTSHLWPHLSQTHASADSWLIPLLGRCWRFGGGYTARGRCSDFRRRQLVALRPEYAAPVALCAKVHAMHQAAIAARESVATLGWAHPLAGRDFR